MSFNYEFNLMKRMLVTWVSINGMFYLILQYNNHSYFSYYFLFEFS